ncbi:MAG: GntR family transcriptional regulator [Oscillospiraceae bacterium]
MFTMRLHGGAPIYEQLGNRITELILSGEMAEGEKLPAVREIATTLSINPNTVQKTYAELERQGLIYSLPAKGSYVSERSRYIKGITEKAAADFEEAVRTAHSRGLDEDALHDIITKITREVTPE